MQRQVLFDAGLGPTATHMGTHHSTVDWHSDGQRLPSRTEVMILTTLIALWARKGSFRYSADNKVFLCPASHACQDTNRVRTLPQPEVFSGKDRSLSLSLASLMVMSCPVKLWGSAVMLGETRLLFEHGVKAQSWQPEHRARVKQSPGLQPMEWPGLTWGSANTCPRTGT